MNDLHLWNRQAPHRALALSLTLLAAASFAACSQKSDSSKPGAAKDAGEAGAPSGKPDAVSIALIKSIKQTETWSLPGLVAEVHVARTQANVPHIYAANRLDLFRAHGFVAARDRFFMMDMMRRLGRGTVSALFGAAGWKTDVQSRGTGMTAVGERVCANLSAEMAPLIDAYTDGVNSYIEAVKANKLPPPSEVKVAAGLLGFKTPADAMQPFARADTCAALAVVLFQQGYETADIARAARYESVESATAGKPAAALRRAGLRDDVMGRQAPLYKISTTPGYGLDTNDTNKADAPLGVAGQATRPAATLRAAPLSPAWIPALGAERLWRLHERLRPFLTRLGKANHRAFGSNIWTVAGSHTKNGAALLASDGHLQLSVPSLFWQLGLDTSVFGGGETHQLGLTFAGIPVMAAGTNGDVAWSNTYLYGDITDYYAEQLQLDGDGKPVSTRFKGAAKPLVETKETYDVRAVQLLGSAGGKRELLRFETWDGRPLVDIEGRPPTDKELANPGELSKGEMLLNVLGDWVIPSDVDKDGKITAISMDLTSFDVGDTPSLVDAIGHSKTVSEARAHQRGLVGWAQNTMYADKQGSIAYSGYNPTPCRSYLPRANGDFTPGANPQRLLDGTTYRGFHVKLDPQGHAVEDSKDPYECAIPYSAWPQAQDPSKGYIVNANNDFGGTTLDGALGDDKWYIGGPFVLGLRAKQIDDSVKQLAASKKADIASMQMTQALHSSLFGCRVAPLFADAIDMAKSATPSWLEASERLKTWVKAGCPAESGVETFYHQPTAAARSHAVSTMLFNAMFAELQWGMWHDEGMQLGSVDILRATVTLLEGRGANNPAKLSSFDPERAESVFFDDASTPGVESSEAIIRAAVGRALQRLAKPDGFGSRPMAEWLWGMKHMVKFEWLLAAFLADQPSLLAIANMFSITTETVPLRDNLPAKDPRRLLASFPRPGDYGAPDASAPRALRSYNGEDLAWDFTYSHGPVMRMVIALGGAPGFAGQNVIPGGQSAITESPYFADQVKLWLGNKTITMHLRPADVAKHAIGRELLVPTK